MPDPVTYGRYRALVLADSICPDGHRLTTMELTFPRPYLAELNTHRALSRNSESSRAIPTELQIERVREDPYVPEFRERVKGMGGGVLLTGTQRVMAKQEWINASVDACVRAESLLHVAKDDANRLLEPFQWHTAIVSATEWDNFLNLRDHEAAAIPMQRIARLVRQALTESTPEELYYGDWHLPFITPGDSETDEMYGKHGWMGLAEASAGICARSSYSKHNAPELLVDSRARWSSLSQSGHWSPGEHPARCQKWSPQFNNSNFKGWMQLRKFYPGEDVFHD